MRRCAIFNHNHLFQELASLSRTPRPLARRHCSTRRHLQVFDRGVRHGRYRRVKPHGDAPIGHGVGREKGVPGWAGLPAKKVVARGFGQIRHAPRSFSMRALSPRRPAGAWRVSPRSRARSAPPAPAGPLVCGASVAVAQPFVAPFSPLLRAHFIPITRGTQVACALLFVHCETEALFTWFDLFSQHNIYRI